VAALDAIVLPDLEPSKLLGLELCFLDAVCAGRCRPVLLIYTLAGRVISIGRYHLYAGGAERGGVRAYRRLTGGRIVGGGEGWLGVALILPSRQALTRERDSGLKPEQVMNRYVRGTLNAPRGLGVDPFYPGRDTVAVGHREIAMCSFETNASGALLFEMLLAVKRGMEDLAGDLERFDPGGALTSAIYTDENATTLVRELGRDVDFEELVDAVARGYGDLLGGVERRELTSAEDDEADSRGAALETAGWLNARKPDPTLDKTGRAGSQLGFVEARLRLHNDHEIDAITVSGDFIANSPGLARFERELVGRTLDYGTVMTTAVRIFGDGSNFILGIGELANLVRLVMKAS
jgi:lipoate-protein ligase A